jgi:glycosyltransferase involved in cell wall biosynthesis
MDGEIILSILTPAVPSRLTQLGCLCANIDAQIGNLPVEHLVLLDNKRRTVGEKRDALLRASRGKYVAFVDDDDTVAESYVQEILDAAKSDPDVITFKQLSVVNGQSAHVDFRLGNPNEPFAAGTTFKRNAWHVCAWRRRIAIMSRFPPVNYGEDWAFAAPLCAIPGLKEAHIDNVLHVYRHDEKTTEAPPPS